MLTVNVRTDIDERIIRKLSRAGSAAEHITAIQIEKDTEPFVPALTGSLTSRTRVKGNMIIYPGPYARYLYYGKLMVDPKTKSPYAKKGAVKVITDKNLVYTRSFHPQAQSHWFEASKAVNMEKWARVAGKAAAREFRK